MECFRKAVIVGDTCHDVVIYMPVLHQAMALHSFSSLSERILAHPPATVYSFIFTPGLCRSDMGVFLSARDENMPVQACVRWWPWRWDSPITTIYVICMPSCVCVMCVSTSMRALIHRYLILGNHVFLPSWLCLNFASFSLSHWIPSFQLTIPIPLSTKTP